MTLNDTAVALERLTPGIEHCARGASIWTWAGNDDGSREPDIVLACAGDVVTRETVAAAQILQKHLPQLRVRVVNLVDLMALIRPKDHPHGMSEVLFSELFTDSANVIFAFHGFPGAVHQLIHGRPDADRFHVRGFIEQEPPRTTRPAHPVTTTASRSTTVHVNRCFRGTAQPSSLA